MLSLGHYIILGRKRISMDIESLRKQWLEEEQCAHIHGWDFSHIEGRYREGDDIPWDYSAIVKRYLRDDMEILDYDTGGGEFLLSLGHPYGMTSATEGFPPNVQLCREELEPLGIRFRECSDASRIPFDDCSFDMILNRHGDFDPVEIFRLLRSGGMFITQQVGEQNDRDLVEMVLPGTPLPFPGMRLSVQQKAFEDAGFRILESDEAFRPIEFYDIGAFVWFARIIEWEFPGFSVEGCFDRLLEMQQILDRDGLIRGMAHRYMIVAVKD